MAQIDVNIRMDEDLKRDFDNLCSNSGLNMAVVFNVFAKTVVKRQVIPFEISIDALGDASFDTELYAKDPFFNRATQAEMRRRIADIKANGNEVLVDFDPTEQRLDSSLVHPTVSQLANRIFYILPDAANTL